MAHPRRPGVLVIAAAVSVAALLVISSPQAQAGFCQHRFAAIAYSACTGRYGYTSGRTCMADAKSEAIANCGARDARVVACVENGWVALARAPIGSAYGYGWSTRSLADAEAIALRACPGYVAVWAAS